ncbi:acetyl-CoA hydrolase/transferase family protein [Ornithinibacillus halotolerans]|uniref:4-hydroxybutyrate CoA-transferase n=1 Tax=Ornithinibacillus halotolerans TaxID=1274357 RepID=A0A916SCT0_9BACI|nr:acetyl-CoA hydrolase/transferase C-terminal domain-containing protein [Ornithinibacillus halotolerans]GGA93086.1 4-hydroxybutyrate CoA-transferase [Ornithinibacillus halotolerans]
MQSFNEKNITQSQLLSILSNYEDIIVGMANGEPDCILSIIDENPTVFKTLSIHQLLEMKNRRYIQGEHPNIRYISYFMSKFARRAFSQGKCELVPNHFHQIPRILEQKCKQPIIVCQASPIDDDGYFSLGTEAEYIAHFIGKAPFILQVNEQVPRTYGKNNIHISQVEGLVHHNQDLTELPVAPIQDIDRQIASFIAERIECGSTLQVGIGGIPNAVVSLLKEHKELGIHTEMLTDGVVDLVESGAVTGNRKNTNRRKIVATFALGTKSLYDFMHENKELLMLPVNEVNVPRNIAREDKMISINATTEIDFYGQCASETVAGKYYSSTGGQADFGSGVRFSKEGKGFICLYSTAKNDTISRIKPILTPGSVVTTSKNDVDYVVTEYGIAELSGKSIFERTKSLINIAHPKFREELLFKAKKMGFWV